MPLFKAPAKINIGLNIGPSDPDGYHYIESFMQTVDFCDDVEIEKAGAFHFSATGYDFPPEEENLCVKAYRVMSRIMRVEKPVSIRLTKRIPVGAGLGGGSSDAAAVIRGLNQLWSGGLKPTEMADIGAKVGADVPFFLAAPQGAAFCSGRGEVVEPMKPIWKGAVVIVFNGVEVSTVKAYKIIDNNLTKKKKNVNLKRYILQYFPAQKGLNGLKNDFSQVVFRQYRDLEEVALSLLEQGALYSSLSGSGSAIYGLFSERDKAERAVVNLPAYALKIASDTPAQFYQ